MRWREGTAWALALLTVGTAWGLYLDNRTLSLHNGQLASDYKACLVGTNRVTRASTNFRYPKLGPYELEQITVTAQALRWPWELLKAAALKENGGMLLDLGAAGYDEDIKQNWPPDLWQWAQGVRIMQQEAGRMVLEDPEVANVYAHRLALRWKAADILQWRDQFISCLNTVREEKAGPRPAPAPHKPKAAKRRKHR